MVTLLDAQRRVVFAHRFDVRDRAVRSGAAEIAPTSADGTLLGKQVPPGGTRMGAAGPALRRPGDAVPSERRRASGGLRAPSRFTPGQINGAHVPGDDPDAVDTARARAQVGAAARALLAAYRESGVRLPGSNAKQRYQSPYLFWSPSPRDKKNAGFSGRIDLDVAQRTCTLHNGQWPGTCSLLRYWSRTAATESRLS